MPEHVVACPVCSGQEFHAVEPFADGRIITHYSACGRCGLVVMNPKPNPAELAAYYEGEYWTDRAGDDAAKRKKQARRAGFILAFLERHLGVDVRGPLARRSRVLEVGSSFGMTLLQIRDRIAELGGGVTLYGVEPSDHAVTSSHDAYRHIHAVGKRWEDLQTTPAGPFDLVILSHVLEHLDDPVTALAVIRDNLAPGGVLFIEVPNFYGHPSVEYAHNFCFTETSLRNTVARAGMKVTSLEVNGHDEDFPFYLTCLAIPSAEEATFHAESVAEIRARRTAALTAFQELRRRQPRP